MDDEAVDPSGQDWGPTAGMTAEERMGYEMVRTLEGQLVTDDTFRAHTRAMDRVIAATEHTLARQHHQLIWTRIGTGIAVIALTGVAIYARVAAADAKDSASAVRKQSTCNQLILASIAAREVDATGYQIGCDMRPAEQIVHRALENARVTAEQSQKSLELFCSVLTLDFTPSVRTQQLAANLHCPGV